MSSSPNLLSQQTIAWLLKSAGLLAGGGGLKGVSPSTVKSAHAKRPILRSWEPLVDALLVVLGYTPDAVQRTRLLAGLHDWDQRVSRLDTLGLPTSDLLPAVLRVLGPQLGVRFGAWAALEHHRPSVPGLPAADWLTDPLSPATFGRVVEWLFARHYPALDTWTDRYARLPNGISRTTVEDWRSEEKRQVPNAASLDDVATIAGERHAAHALGLLRAARVLACAGEDLAAIGGASLADEFREMVRTYARVARTGLTSPMLVAELADGWASALEGPDGAAVLAAAAPLAGWGPVEVPATEVARRIRDRTAKGREVSNDAELRWVIALTLSGPAEVVVAWASANLGAADALGRAMADPLELIQAEWRSTWFFGRITEGGPMAFTRGAAPEALKPLSDGTRDLARRALVEGRKLIRRATDPEPEAFLHHRLMINLGLELGGDQGLRAMVAALNTAGRVAAAPTWMERFVETPALDEFPHLMAERVRRLASDGDDAEAFAWIRRWATSDAPRSPDERRRIAEATVAIAHRLADTARPVREVLRTELPVPVQELPEPLAAQVRTAAETGLAAFDRVLTTADRLFELAGQLYAADEGSPEEVERIVTLLPLALRLDYLAAEAAQEEEVYLPRSENLGARLDAADRALPDHGPAWATSALWRKVLGEEPSVALRWATHFGSRDLYEVEVRRLVEDGVLTESAR